MKLSTIFTIAFLLEAAACSSSSSPATEQASGGASATGQTSSVATSSETSTSTSTSTTASGESSSNGAGGAPSSVTATSASAGGGDSIDMPRISGGVPAFASSGPNDFTGPQLANDDVPTSAWSPPSLPAWIAYDLSKVPSAERQSALVVWNSLHAGLYINDTPPSGGGMPTAYTIETNAAAGGTAAPPTDGWVTVATVTNNLRDTVEHPIQLNGGNWVRMSITEASDPSVSVDLDVFSTPHGASDCWMFMGDSVTYITMGYAWSNIPQLVNQTKADRWPANINAALGGTNTNTALMVIDDTMAGYPGRYVILAYGTNDHAVSFEMEDLVKKVIAAGKVPVVPHMPWSSGSTEGEMINAQIDALYVKYPQILKGPDLWAAFLNRTDLIPAGDVHPNQAGQAVLRQQWADTMAAVP